MAESQVIARKFRPQTFTEVVGQDAITRTLSNSIKTGRIHHAYLFAGARGVGKTTTARILAKALNCANGVTTEPCGVCDSCREIAASRSMDVLEIDAASNTGVDNVRDVIISTVQISPARDRYKIFIIDEVHQLSSAAFNALLKTLEEPPPRVAFIMATTELHKVPETILSRCQVFEFRTISLKRIFEQLRQITDNLKVEISDAALRAVARAGEGSMRDAESALDQVISFAGTKVSDEDVSAALGLVDIETLNTTVRAISDQDAQKVLRTIEEVVSRGYDLRNFCRELMVHIRALLVIKVAGFDPELLQMAQGEGEQVARLADAFSEQDLVRFFSILTKTEQEIRTSSQPRFQLEIGLIKLVQARRLYLLEDAINKIVELQSRIGAEQLPSAPPRTADRPRAVAETPARKAFGSADSISKPTPLKTEPARPQKKSSAFADATPFASTTSKGETNRAGAAPPVKSLPPEEPPPILDEPYDLEADLTAAAPAEFERVEPNAIDRIKTELESKRKMMLLAAIEKAQSMELDGPFLRLVFASENAVFKNQIESRDNRKLIEAICREVLGRAVSLSITVAGQASAPQPVSKKEARAASPQAEEHPAVRALLDKFHGEVIEIVKPES
jgi:DNA polymerase III subunit gamma/tau